MPSLVTRVFACPDFVVVVVVAAAAPSSPGAHEPAVHGPAALRVPRARGSAVGRPGEAQTAGDAPNTAAPQPPVEVNAKLGGDGGESTSRDGVAFAPPPCARTAAALPTTTTHTDCRHPDQNPNLYPPLSLRVPLVPLLPAWLPLDPGPDWLRGAPRVGQVRRVLGGETKDRCRAGAVLSAGGG